MDSPRTTQFNWSQLIPLIAEVGIPAGYKLWQLAQEDTPVTAKQWADLHRLANKTAGDYLIEARAKADGLPLANVECRSGDRVP